MKTLLQVLAVAIGLSLAAGEIARRWNDPHFVPLALDELGSAGALCWAAWRAHSRGPAALVAGWSIFSGLMLMLLSVNVDFPIHGLPKASGIFYSAVLSMMLLLGLWATWQSLRLTEARIRD